MAEKPKAAAGKRQIHYDLLRIAACFSVIMLHSASQFWYELPVTDATWLTANSYDAMFRFGVPVFVMISGALFLDERKELNVRRLYTHNIFRLLAAYVFWCCAYGLWDCRYLKPGEADWKFYVTEMMGGRYHLWFVPMLIGIYVLVPVLKGWIKGAGRRGVEYFLLLFLAFQIGRETLLIFVTNGNFRQQLDYFTMELVCSYVGYFVLGYYLARIGLEKKWHKWIYAGGTLGLAGAVFFGNMLSLRKGEPQSAAYDSFSLFTMLVSTALFLAAQEKWGRRELPEGAAKVVRELSDATFGIYLLHILVLEGLQDMGIHSMMINNIAGIPVLSIVCFVLCYGVTAVLRRIPLIGKYIC